MNLNTNHRPKLSPAFAAARAADRRAAERPHSLPPRELRRIVAEMLG